MFMELNVSIERVALQHHVQNVSGTNLSLEASRHDQVVFFTFFLIPSRQMPG
jgi:hypothetical protein